jgi:hypothetical protein
MSGRTEVKEGMYAEDISESERREQYELTAEDIEEITAVLAAEADEE